MELSEQEIVLMKQPWCMRLGSWEVLRDGCRSLNWGRHGRRPSGDGETEPLSGKRDARRVIFWVYGILLYFILFFPVGWFGLQSGRSRWAKCELGEQERPVLNYGSFGLGRLERVLRKFGCPGPPVSLM